VNRILQLPPIRVERQFYLALYASEGIGQAHCYLAGRRGGKHALKLFLGGGRMMCGKRVQEQRFERNCSRLDTGM
jgi:hypothetical protein